MNIYISSDTHFGHDKMIELCGRPIGFENLIVKGFKVLQPDDLLIHLGDICIGKDAERHEQYIQPIKCKKILCKGNHDQKSNSWYLSHGWDFVCDSFADVYFGKRIVFSHIPQRYMGQFDINIHGHFHNSDFREQELAHLVSRYHKLLAIENTNYKLVNLKDFIN